MNIYAFLNLTEFEDLCMSRLENTEWLIKNLRNNMENGSAQSYEKTVQDIDDVINKLMRVKLDMESASTKLVKEYSNDKN